MRAREALRRPLPQTLLPLLPATVLVAVVIAWVATGGGYESQPALDTGYEPDPWYLGALAIVALLCACAFGMGRVRMARASKVAIAALFAYVAWSFASVLWAHDQGAAFHGSVRALVYFAAFAAFAVLPWRDLSARLAIGAVIAGIGVIAIVAAAKVASVAAPGSLYLGARLAWPMGYYNADAVLFMGAAAGAIALGAQRCTPAVLRVAAITLAGLCLQLAVLSQSRGWLFSTPIVLALMLLLIPGRVRLLLFALVPAAATAVVAPALLRVYGKAAPSGETLPPARLNAVLHSQGSHAVKTMLIADVVLAVVTALLVLADRRMRLAPAAQQRFDRASRAVAVAVVIVGVAIGLVAVHGHVVGRVESAWKSFAHTTSPSAGGYSHFTTLASDRADIWRVALHEFAANPIGGIGQDNFAAGYIRLRHTYEQPRWTHSIELRLLTHTGLVGALLFVTFLVAALMAALRGRRGTARATAGILLVFLVVWLVQGSIDWFWEYPALSVPALAFAAAAGALDRVEPLRGSGRRRGGSLLAAAATVLLGAGALAAVAIPFAAARHARTATRIWETEPQRAYEQVRSASDLLPFDDQLYLLGGSIALNQGEYARARGWLEQAEQHDSQNWLSPFALGIIDGERAQRAQAAAQLRRARQLNPLESTVQMALERLHEGHPLSFEEAQQALAPHIVTQVPAQ
ncbi:MAG TPA: O-antigen ligase family protein [Solirubrobacteraceae bacterium]|nr:O-antigen ligase family protein [Solirubrobacteraceae bacterium]